MVYYNEKFYLAQSLYALRHYVDGVILVDGVFEGFGDTLKSTDDSHYIIKDFMDNISLEIKHHFPHTYWKNEPEKRQFAIDQVPEGDDFIIIDPDELILGDPKYFRKELSMYDDLVMNTMIIDHVRPASWWLYPRVYHKTVPYEYKHLHNALAVDGYFHWDKPVNKQRILKSIVLLHMSEFYIPPERLAQKHLYNLRKRDHVESIANTRIEVMKQDTRRARDAIKKMYEAKKEMVGKEGLRVK